ncbi:MAG: hypothetical protein H0T73_12015, partial [Ardenticatenales bacterium]|nr:hypothetical protein [Ardenticatenales bacterium]
MGIFDFLTSTKRPAEGTPALSQQEVQTAILGLNRESAPYRIVDGAAEQVDLIAEWRIVEAEWYELFAKAGLTKVFRIFVSDPRVNLVGLLRQARAD